MSSGVSSRTSWILLDHSAVRTVTEDDVEQLMLRWLSVVGWRRREMRLVNRPYVVWTQ